jgi:hypothetical protein
MKEQTETLTKTQITIMAQRASLRAFQKETLEKLISHEYSMKDAMAALESVEIPIHLLGEVIE